MTHIKKLFVACLVVVMMLCGCRHTLQDQSDSSDKTELNQNFTKELSMVEDENNYYYIDKNIIYQKNKLSATALQLYQHQTVNDSLSDLFVYDNHLYFFATNQTPYFEIFRINLKLGDVEKVTDYSEITQNDDEFLHSCVYLDGKIYIQMSFKLYCYDIESKISEKLHDDVGNYQFYNGALYFIDHAYRTFSIYKMDLETKKTEIVLGDGEWCEDKTKDKKLYKNFVFIGDIMFYYMRTPDGLYMYKDGKSTLISDNTDINEFSLCEYQNELYFVKNYDEMYILMKYNPSDQKSEEVAILENYAGYGYNMIKNGRFYYKGENNNLFYVEI